MWRLTLLFTQLHLTNVNQASADWPCTAMQCLAFKNTPLEVMWSEIGGITACRSSICHVKGLGSLGRLH
jgi:hypothetical protein